MSNVAIIPARGGSKRIPGKNIRLFAGKPVIAYPIQTALESQLFDRVIVSTDSDEIADVAVKFGAEVPFVRPSDLSDDHTATAPVLVHALQWLEDHGCSADYFCCIYATTPLIQVQYLRQGFDLLKSMKVNIAFPVAKYDTPIFRALKTNDAGMLEMIWPEYEMTRSQDLPTAYFDAGQFYWGDTRAFLIEQKLYSERSVPIIIPSQYVQDIDTPEDWEKAEALYRAMQA